jgi:hypothetical protein
MARICNDTMVPLLFFISPFEVVGALYALGFILVIVNHLEGTSTDEQYFISMAIVKRHNVDYYAPYLAYRICKPPWTTWTFFWVLPKFMFRVSCVLAAKYLDDDDYDYHDINDWYLTRSLFKVYEYTHFALSRFIARWIRAKLLSREPPLNFVQRRLESREAFRLLRIRPGLFTQQPLCEVEHHILDNAPPFEWRETNPRNGQRSSES